MSCLKVFPVPALRVENVKCQDWLTCRKFLHTVARETLSFQIKCTANAHCTGMNETYLFNIIMESKLLSLIKRRACMWMRAALFEAILCVLNLREGRCKKIINFNKESCTKGQLISKCLFGVINFLQKTNKNKSTWGFIVS